MKPRVLLLVDLSNQCYKASAAFPTLTSEGRFTGGLYGFLSAVEKAITVTGATEMAVCEDCKPYVRSNLYPEYKQLRKETRDEDLYERAQFTIQLVKEMLDVVGWPLWAVPGFESDDLIGLAATKYRHRYSKIVGMSNDSDLYQLFKYENFQLYKGTKGLYTREDYNQEWQGLSFEDLPMALAFMGTHNDVAGVPGIGPVRARKIVSHPFMLRQALEQHRKIVERNIQLISLPHADLPRSIEVPKPTKRYSERDLMRYCGRYDINVTKAMISAFDQIGKV